MRMAMFALAMVLVAAAVQAQEGTLTGVWTATSAERDGAAAPDLVGHRLTFNGDRFGIVSPDGSPVFGGTFVADASSEPPSIDFSNTSGEAAGVTWLGIWKLAGDVLTI